MNDTTDAVEETSVDQTEDAPATATEEPRRKGSTKSRLEEEGDIAADYLEELLDIVDLDGDIDIDIENGRASVAVVADEAGTPALSRLVGWTVRCSSVQELTRLACRRRRATGRGSCSDVAGHRSTKRTSLVRLAHEVVARVQSSVRRSGSSRCRPSSARSSTTPLRRRASSASPRARSRVAASSSCPPDRGSTEQRRVI